MRPKTKSQTNGMNCVWKSAKRPNHVPVVFLMELYSPTTGPTSASTHMNRGWGTSSLFLPRRSS